MIVQRLEKTDVACARNLDSGTLVRIAVFPRLTTETVELKQEGPFLTISHESQRSERACLRACDTFDVLSKWRM